MPIDMVGEIMKDKYWKEFYDIRKTAYYYQLYAVSSSRWNTFISAGCAIASTVFVGSVFFSQNAPIAWAIITLVLQVILAIQPQLPFFQRKQSAHYIFQDMNKLAYKAEHTWDDVSTEKMTDEEIDSKIREFRAEKDAIEERFANCDTFPDNAIIEKKAEKRANIYFRRFENND